MVKGGAGERRFKIDDVERKGGKEGTWMKRSCAKKVGKNEEEKRNREGGRRGGNMTGRKRGKR